MWIALLVDTGPCRSTVFNTTGHVHERLLNYSTVDNVEVLRYKTHWPSLRIQPTACSKKYATKSSKQRFLVVVHSSIHNFERRQRFRREWDNGQRRRLHFDIIFAIGRSLNISIQKQAEAEAVLHGDILQSNVVDNYKLLPAKAGANALLSNLLTQNLGTRMAPVDDDVTVNLMEFRKFADHQRKRTRAVFCSTFKHIADRRIESKWFLSYSEFPFRNLGIFCAGLAYSITADLIPEMYKNSKSRRFVWLDDWYVTHALLTDLDFTMYDISDFYFVSETKREAYSKLRDVLDGRRPTPLFSHLRPRAYFTQEKQSELWQRSQLCPKYAEFLG